MKRVAGCLIIALAFACSSPPERDETGRRRQVVLRNKAVETPAGPSRSAAQIRNGNVM